jgi:hypothetical protein
MPAPPLINLVPGKFGTPLQEVHYVSSRYNFSPVFPTTVSRVISAFPSADVNVAGNAESRTLRGINGEHASNATRTGNCGSTYATRPMEYTPLTEHERACISHCQGVVHQAELARRHARDARQGAAGAGKTADDQVGQALFAWAAKGGISLQAHQRRQGIGQRTAQLG